MINPTNQLNYHYCLDEDVLLIKDLGSENIVTQYIREVLSQIEEEVNSLEGKYVLFAGQQSVWDAIILYDQQYTLFPLNVSSYHDACRRLAERVASRGPAFFQFKAPGHHQSRDRADDSELSA